MRKIKLDKETVLNANLINDLIEKHAEEKNRIIKMKNYYNGLNEAIMNRAYTDKNKPSNKLVSGYPSYITDNFVGYMVGQPITYKSDNNDLLEKLNLNFLYNDEVDHNTTLAQEQSICGYAYELLYRDEDSNARFTCLETENTIVVYENNLEEKDSSEGEKNHFGNNCQNNTDNLDEENINYEKLAYESLKDNPIFNQLPPSAQQARIKNEINKIKALGLYS